MNDKLELDGNVIEMEFVQKPWIRNSYLRFDGDRLVVVSRNERTMRKVVSTHRTWISKHYGEIKNSVMMFKPGSVFYRTKHYPVRHVVSAARPRADVQEDSLMLYSKDGASAERLIDRIFMEDTERIARSLATEKAQSLGVSFREIKVRRYRKWGACSTSGLITINYVLSMLPQELQDYIVSHEVAHLKQMNHSSSFWKVVESICPNYKAARKELKRYDSRRRQVYLPMNVA